MEPLSYKRLLGALGFISKDQPFEDFTQELIRALDKATELSDIDNTNKKNYFSFKIGSRYYKFELNDILLIETSDLPHRIDLYTKDKNKYSFYGRLSEIAEQLPSFFKVDRACLINPVSIKEDDFSKREIIFNDHLTRYFSFRKSGQLKSIVNKL